MRRRFSKKLTAGVSILMILANTSPNLTINAEDGEEQHQEEIVEVQPEETVQEETPAGEPEAEAEMAVEPEPEPVQTEPVAEVIPEEVQEPEAVQEEADQPEEQTVEEVQETVIETPAEEVQEPEETAAEEETVQPEEQTVEEGQETATETPAEEEKPVTEEVQETVEEAPQEVSEEPAETEEKPESEETETASADEPEATEETAEEPEEEPAEEEESYTLVFAVDGEGTLITAPGTEDEKKDTELRQELKTADDYAVVYAEPAEGYVISSWDLNGETLSLEDNTHLDAEHILLQDGTYTVHFEKEVTEIKETKTAGDAEITVTYMSDAFDEPVTLSVEEVVTGHEAYAGVVDSLDTLAAEQADFDYSSFKAYDISFFTENGEKKEPGKEISVQIHINDSWTDENTESANLVHINDNGTGEVLNDADINDTATDVSFANDQFSVYVVTTKSAEELGNVIVGDQTFTTLAAALEAASDGDTINIVGTTEDTDTVSVNKSVTILSNGEDGTLSIGLNADAGTIQLGGGDHTLTMGSVWCTSADTVDLSIEDNVHITGGLPIYLNNVDATLRVHGGKIEQTVTRDDGWGYAIGAYDGLISEITGGEIIALQGGIKAYSTIDTISGGTITAGEYGMYIGWATVNEISGGTINSKDHGIYMYYANTVDTISGGTVTSENGSAIYTGNWENDNVINSISGGIFVGKSAISGTSLENEAIDISGGAFKATGTDAITEDVIVDFTNGVETVRWIGKLYPDSYTVPDEYAPSTDTVTVDGVDGDFQYFAKKITVTYDGNGGKTENNQTTYTQETTAKFKTAENKFFHPDEMPFKEWNTKADGTGTSYGEEKQAESEEDITLYAIWDDSEGPVSIGDVQYKNIRAAMAAAQDGDVIKVNGNTVDTNDPINVDKNVTIIAGNPDVKSTRANLNVVEGKKLILGDGNAESVLTMTGKVDVRDGSLEFNDGITLKNTITLWGESATAAVKGGKIAADSFAMEVRDGATVTEISGGELSSKNAAALFVRKGVVENISGENTSFTADDDSAVVVWYEGEIQTIDNGRFISKKRSGYSAALYVEGKLGTINDGFFEGYLGVQISGEERDAVSPDTTKILGGEFYGKGGGRGNAINLGQIDNGESRHYVVENVKAVSDNDFAILVGHNNIVEKISNVTASGGWGGLRLYNGSYQDLGITVGLIENSTFTYTGNDRWDFALEMGKHVHITTIRNTVFDGGVGGGAEMGVWSGVESTVTSIEGCQFLGSSRSTGVENYASIGTITGTKITGSTALANGYKDGTYGDIGTLGEGNVFTGTEYGIDNIGPIENITGGTYTGGVSGLHNGRISEQQWAQDPETGSWGSVDVDQGPSTIGNITGSVFSGAVGIDNEGTITSISGPVDVTGTEGPAVKSAENGAIGTISGAGVYKGSDNAIQINNANQKTKLEPGITAIRGDGRYQTGSNTVDSEFNQNTNLILPDGYHVSTVTTSVNGQSGEFRYLVKDNTIIYRGNGEGHVTEDGDAEVFKSYDSAEATVEGNDTIGFNPNNLEFIGWTAQADGSGDSYKAGDTITIPANEEVVLYAQWGIKITYKSADKTMGSVKQNDEATQQKENDEVTEVIAPNEAVAEAFGLSAEPKGATAETASDSYSFVNWTDESGTEVSTDATFVPTEKKAATYTANFKKLWNVTFDTDGGEPVSEEQTIVDGEKASKPEKDPAKEEYTFVGWYEVIDGEMSDSAFDFDTAIDHDTVLKAKYELQQYYYYYSDTTPLWVKDSGVTADFTVKRSINDQFTFPRFTEILVDGVKVDPSLYTAKAGSVEESLSAEYMQTLDVGMHTLTTNFTDGTVDTDFEVVDKETVVHDVTFDSDGGSEVGKKQVEDGKPVAEPAVPTKEGYTFEGWYLNGEKYDFRTPVTKDIVLKAKWTAVTPAKPAKPNGSGGQKPAVPNTRDETHLQFWLLMLILSLAGGLGSMFVLKTRRQMRLNESGGK